MTIEFLRIATIVNSHGLVGGLTVTQDDYDSVHFLVAKRQGTFDEATVAGWADYWRSRDRSQIRWHSIALFWSRSL